MSRPARKRRNFPVEICERIALEMKINKSTRHSKITGTFGEALILYWLSKYGFECALIDHTGIDIIARNPHTKELMGISVKSRSRTEGAEKDYVGIPYDNLKKVTAACNAFGCAPYFAIVVDAGDTLNGFIIPMKHLLNLSTEGGKTYKGWRMRKSDLEKYAQDPKIKSFIFKTKTVNWW